MAVDQRNLKTLVDNEFNDKLSRIPPGLQKDIASIMLRVELYRRYSLVKAADLLENYVNRWLRLMVSDQGKGRAEMVAAIQSEQGQIQQHRIGETPTVIVQNGTNGPKHAPVKERKPIWERLNQGLK